MLRALHFSSKLEARTSNLSHGFTLIETLVAITLLVVSIVAPMALVSQSLTTALYARDQVTAYNLAQEGIETVRAVRDGNVLTNGITGTSLDLLTGIPIGQDFRADARESDPALALVPCNGTCPVLQTDGTVFGYGIGTDTKFRRVVYAQYSGPATINPDPVSGKGRDEIRVTVTISWETETGLTRTFKMYSNMYRWVEDGIAQ